MAVELLPRDTLRTAERPRNLSRPTTTRELTRRLDRPVESIRINLIRDPVQPRQRAVE